MSKKIVLALAVILLFALPALGVQRRHYHVTFVDEWGDPRTDATQVTVQNESGVAVAVYSTQTGTTEVGSTGVITTGLSDGTTEFWYEDLAIDLGVTDGTSSLEIESFPIADTRFWFPNHLTEFSGTDYGQTDDLDFTYANFVIDGDTANRLDIIPDNDGGIVAFGDATTQVDLYLYSGGVAKYFFFDEGSEEVFLLDIDIQFDDAAKAIFGTNDDFAVYSDTANILEFDPGTQGNEIRLGTASTDSVVVTWYGDSSGDTVVFDEENNMVEFEDISLAFGDDTKILFGDTIGTGDISLSGNSSAVLQFLQVVADTGTITFGAAGTDIPITWYGETSGSDAILTGDNFLLDGMDMLLGDGDFVMFGDHFDWTIDSSTATELDIVPLTTDETSVVNIGADTLGADLKIFGATTGEYWSYDASTDTITVNTGNALYTMTDAEANQFKVDATGTVAGNAVVLQTTDGGIEIKAQGATNGDIVINAASQFNIDAGDDFVVDVAGAAGQDFLFTNTGGSYIFTATEANAVDAVSVVLSNRGSMSVTGGLTTSRTVMSFEHEPVCANWGANGTAVWGGIATGTANDENIAVWPDGSLIYHMIGTQSVLGPISDPNGYDFSLDDTNAEGVEWCPGYVGEGEQVFTVGTDDFYIKVTMTVSDVSGFSDLAVGFRLQENFQDTIEAYNSYNCLSIAGGNINHMREINGGSAVDVDTGDDWADNSSHTLEVRVSSTANTVTYFIDGDTPTTPVSHTWTDADQVTPFLFILNDSDVGGPVNITRWECGLQN